MVEIVLVIVAIVSAIVGGAMSADSQRKQAHFQEDMAEYNAEVAVAEADHTRAATDIKARQHRLRVAQTVGKQRAAMGASGVAVDQGSFLDLTLDTVEQGKIDELALLYEGELSAWRIDAGRGLTEAQGAQYGYLASQQNPALSGLMAGVATGANFYASGGFGGGDGKDPAKTKSAKAAADAAVLR